MLIGFNVALSPLLQSPVILQIKLKVLKVASRCKMVWALINWSPLLWSHWVLTGPRTVQAHVCLRTRTGIIPWTGRSFPNSSDSHHFTWVPIQMSHLSEDVLASNPK